MRQFRTKAIILGRTDFAEADRIITFLTPDHGKVKAIAKGVRKTKSKLAGGIEFFSVSDISFIPGRKEISTVVSTRLITHYGRIVKDLDRSTMAFMLIKRLDKATEEAPEAPYFELMQAAFEALDDFSIDTPLIELWFSAQLLRLAGHTPNLRTDENGNKLEPSSSYSFDFERMCFSPDKQGSFDANSIKFLRLCFSANTAAALNRVKNVPGLTMTVWPLVQAALQAYVRL